MIEELKEITVYTIHKRNLWVKTEILSVYFLLKFFESISKISLDYSHVHYFWGRRRGNYKLPRFPEIENAFGTKDLDLKIEFWGTSM